MTRTEHLEFCNVCLHREFSNRKGIICSHTKEQANFSQSCNLYQTDAVALEQRTAQRKEAAEQEMIEDTLGLSDLGITNGVTAGWISIAIAVAWFLIGLEHLDRIFFFPIILVGLGIAAIVKGEQKKKNQRNGQ